MWDERSDALGEDWTTGPQDAFPEPELERLDTALAGLDELVESLRATMSKVTREVEIVQSGERPRRWARFSFNPEWMGEFVSERAALVLANGLPGVPGVLAVGTLRELQCEALPDRREESWRELAEAVLLEERTPVGISGQAWTIALETLARMHARGLLLSQDPTRRMKLVEGVPVLDAPPRLAEGDLESGAREDLRWTLRWLRGLGQELPAGLAQVLLGAEEEWPWSALAALRALHPGPAGALAPRTLDLQELRSLFVNPRAIGHAADLASAALHGHTGGAEDLVEDCLQVWERAGLLRRQSDQRWEVNLEAADALSLGACPEPVRALPPHLEGALSALERRVLLVVDLATPHATLSLLKRALSAEARPALLGPAVARLVELGVLVEVSDRSTLVARYRADDLAKLELSERVRLHQVISGCLRVCAARPLDSEAQLSIGYCATVHALKAGLLSGARDDVGPRLAGALVRNSMILRSWRVTRGIINLALLYLRLGHEGGQGGGLVRALVLLALYSQDVSWLAEAELRLGAGATENYRRMRELVCAARRWYTTGDSEAVFASLGGAKEVMFPSDPEMECRRHALRVMAASQIAQGGDSGPLRSVLEDVKIWTEGQGHDDATRRLLSSFRKTAEAEPDFRACRYKKALTPFREARTTPGLPVQMRLYHTNNAALCAWHIGLSVTARELATEAIELARLHGLGRLEVESRQILRGVRYQLNEVSTADEALIEAARAVAPGGVLLAQVLQMEAAIVWGYGAGDCPRAVALALEAATIAQKLEPPDDPLGSLLCRAVAAAAGHCIADAECDSLAQTAMSLSDPLIGAQVLGLLRLAAGSREPAWTEDVFGILDAETCGGVPGSAIQEVLSLDQVRQILINGPRWQPRSPDAAGTEGN